MGFGCIIAEILSVVVFVGFFAMTWDESINAAVSILGCVVLGYVVLISLANAEQQNESVRENLSRINLDIAKVTLLNKQSLLAICRLLIKQKFHLKLL